MLLDYTVSYNRLSLVDVNFVHFIFGFLWRCLGFIRVVIDVFKVFVLISVFDLRFFIESCCAIGYFVNIVLNFRVVKNPVKNTHEVCQTMIMMTNQTNLERNDKW